MRLTRNQGLRVCSYQGKSPGIRKNLPVKLATMSAQLHPQHHHQQSCGLNASTFPTTIAAPARNALSGFSCATDRFESTFLFATYFVGGVFYRSLSRQSKPGLQTLRTRDLLRNQSCDVSSVYTYLLLGMLYPSHYHRRHAQSTTDPKRDNTKLRKLAAWQCENIARVALYARQRFRLNPIAETEDVILQLVKVAV